MMSFDMQKVVESKRVLRERLRNLPVGEKLLMLDALRERMLAIRQAAVASQAGAVRESSSGYRAGEAKE